MADRLRGRKGQRRRARIMARDPLCVICKANGNLRPSVEVDHIISLSGCGLDDDSNLQGLCHECHRHKTAVDMGYRPSIGVDGWPIDG